MAEIDAGRPVMIIVTGHAMTGVGYDVVGQTGHKIPLYLLETHIEGNEEWMKDLSRKLYDSQRPEIRLMQEMVLGMGGVKILDLHGLENLESYHMNEGHAAFATLELLKRFSGNKQKVRDRCLFTTHTPVPAGFDVFPYDLANDIIRDQLPKNIREFAGEHSLNMAHLAANLSGYANAVSRRHQKVSKNLFPGTKID